MADKSIKRGDLVKTEGDIIGRVIGWIDDVTVCVQDIEDKDNIVSSWYEQTYLLAKTEELQNLDSLPKEIKLHDTCPEQ